MLLVAAGACLLPLVAVALALRPAWRQHLAERLGRVAATEPGRPAIWIHGASVGEVTALAPLVRMLRRELPSHRLVVSTVTAGGRAAAATRVPEADAVVLFPLDAPWAVRRALTAIAPRIVIFSETELWPNFLSAVAARGTPAVMVSGRLSERAFRRYHRWRRMFVPALASVRVFCVQSIETARRLVLLGAAPERIVVTGSLKGAIADAADAPPAGPTLAALGVGDAPVLVAASTHAGEEDAVLAAFAEARAAIPSARLVLAPRRPERFDDVAADLRARGAAFVRRSESGDAWPASAPILLLDTLGELAGLYAGARAAFVGGTLVPVGGHNVLEPAAAGVPVVFGPFVANAADAAERLAAARGGVQVAEGSALAPVLVRWFTTPDEARAAGARARAVAAAGAGALTVTMGIVRAVLASAPAVGGA